MNKKNLIIIALAGLFFILGFNALQNAKPSYKNPRVYKELKKYIPYYLEKRFGGFSIRKKDSLVKEKPPIEDVYKRLEQLEYGWGQKFLKLNGLNLSIFNENNQTIKVIKLNKKEASWVKEYFLVDKQKSETKSF